VCRRFDSCRGHQQRNPRTTATVNQLLDRYLELLDVDRATRTSYEGYIRSHIRPLLGTLPLFADSPLGHSFQRVRGVTGHVVGPWWY
jgi:hypothetical protein